MNNLYDALEICLQELENGADLESVLARFPDLSGELSPILKASLKARSMSASIPSPEVMRRGRAKLLQRASEMREAKHSPRRRMIPLFQRLAISFTLAALFLASGTGLVGASSTALPGENLYPVKLTWEKLRLLFAFDHVSRDLLEHTFEDERLHEINELFAEGRSATIQFTGIFMEVNGQTYVSGIHIMILETTVLPADPLLNGTAVIVTGHTNTQGFVDVESIELLPAGTIVPTGEPPEIDAPHDQNENVNNNGNENVNDNGNENVNNNGNENVNGNDNENVNNNGNENVNNNDNESVNDNGSGDSGSDNGNENVNDNNNDNVSNDNVNDNSNDNGGDNNINDGGDSGGNDNGSDGGNDGGGDTNDNGGGGDDNGNNDGG